MNDETRTPDELVRAASRKHTRRSFAVAGIAAAAGYGLYKWIDSAPSAGRLQQPLRSTLELNRRVALGLLRERGLAPQFPVEQSSELRLNGIIGLEKQLDLTQWRLQLAGVAAPEKYPQYMPDLTTFEYGYTASARPDQQVLDVKSLPGTAVSSKAAAAETQGRRKRGNAEAGPSSSSLLEGTPGLLLSMANLAALSKVELVTEFKCIEGWSQVVHWAGYRLRDLLDAYPPAMENGRAPGFLYMETPDGDYYGGYDMAAARHPQSLLVTEMAGKPLAQEHGAPLRLHMPIKYGYKQLKRIGLISYMHTRPDDYWTKLGYDWYAGL